MFEPSFLIAVFALVCGITLYEAAFEVARTLLSVRGAALSMILRAVLMVGFGGLSLWLGGGARGLAVAIALAHVLAAAPALLTFADLQWPHWSRAAALHILSYGWPLLLSFGVTAIGQSIDRLLLAHYLGAATLGPYGVVADMLRQSFMVLGEAISLSLVTVAKSHANNGDTAATEITLRRAFNACLATAMFGAAFFIVFGDALLRLVLQPEFVAPAHDLIPLFAIAFAFMTMRNFYFAQVIYFTHASYLDLMVALLFVVVSTVLSVVLVPAYGPHGAAVALMVASIIVVPRLHGAGAPLVRDADRFHRARRDAGYGGAVRVRRAYHRRIDPERSMPLVVDGSPSLMFGGFAIRRFGLLNATPAVALGNVVPARVGR